MTVQHELVSRALDSEYFQNLCAVESVNQTCGEIYLRTICRMYVQYEGGKSEHW
jgi:hypothetical protein